MNLVDIKNLSLQYDKKKALNNINLNIQKGRIIGLLGTNGSGKTSLIKIMNTLISSYTGEILINGKKPGIESKKVISYLPEKTFLPEDKTIRKMISYYKDFFEDFDEKTAYELLKRLELDETQKIKHLSKGTKEKIQLILTMSRNADLYILDEPIGGVDPVARDYILDLILSNFQKESTILLSTHLVSDIERILDDVIFIHNGEIVLTSSADDIRNQYNTSIEGAFKEVFKNVK